MEFWQNNLTEKSWQLLQKLRQGYQFVLIGGWAVWLYTHSLKSRDIDVIVDFNELEKIRKNFTVSKNERLKKYEVKIEDIDIDIYLPFYSQIGLPVEEILKNTRSIEGFTLPIPEMILILKQIVYRARLTSIKGEKDKIDIVSLINVDDLIDFDKYMAILKKYGLTDLTRNLKEMLSMIYEIPELNLNRKKCAELKKKIPRDIIKL